MPNTLSKSRHAAFKRQGGLCYYCGFPIWLEQPTVFVEKYGISKKDSARFQCTAEHLVARQDGGADSRDNIVAACRFCNNGRHRISSPPTPAKFRQYVGRRVHAGKWHPKYIRHLAGFRHYLRRSERQLSA